MNKIPRLAPHGGCNWKGCRECFPTTRERQTWSIPPQPDETVTHVRDFMTDRVWERQGRLWWAPGKSYGIHWHRLISYGPLTDATGDDDD